MSSSTVLAPRLTRIAHLLVVSDDRRILLCRMATGPADRGLWRPPRAVLPAGRAFGPALFRTLLHGLPCTAARGYGDLVGHRWAAPVSGRREEHRVYVLRARPAPAGGAPRAAGACWFPPQGLPEGCGFWGEIGRLAAGYVEGWLPDGPIRLHWE
ncbi:hypothetical protein [Streptomyces klenkii]